MSSWGRLGVIAALAAALVPQAAAARSRHHHPAYGDADPSEGGRYAAPSYHGYTGPGAAVFAATERAQHEPGLTSELDPSARQTATGGPSGGIPNQSGF